MFRALSLLTALQFFLHPAHAHSIPADIEQKNIATYIQRHKTEQLKLLEKLVNINSGTSNAEGVRQVGNLLKPEFEALGFDAQWHDLPAGLKHAGTLVARHTGKSTTRILVIGHLDTVFPPASAFQRFTLSADGNQASGPGVIDDKGGLVTILYAMKALKNAGALNYANITIVLTGDEELAERPTSISRKTLIDAAKESDIAMGFEFALAPDEVVVARRGLSEWVLTATGKAAHSSQLFQPNVGFGAVYEIARVIDAFRVELKNTPNVTMNAGLLLGGQQVTENAEQGIGNASGRKTIIPGNALAHGDLRFMNKDERDKVEASLQKITAHPLPGTQSKVKFEDIMPVMPATNANYALLLQYSAISQELGGPALKAVAPQDRGGADISYVMPYVKAGIDGLGPWGKGAHTENETLDVSSLPTATKRAALFILQKIQE
ncbi:M20 family metallopeptidase [Brucella haematophila]|uniref:M20 family metallopeptidase n=1 Tax=Brucella haematophila TaxID=419474 RepID=UPI00110E4CE8|nr:M20 family metallopeptidase [Brucella haematophila]TMU96426.1 M20 family metallopeptidase [Brucella haematophila]